MNLTTVPFFGAGGTDVLLGDAETHAVVSGLIEAVVPKYSRILLIVPDGTRTGPVGDMFRRIHRQIAGRSRLDVIIALGTHQPMTDAEIDIRLGMAAGERDGTFAGVKFFNHSWDDPASLEVVGTMTASEIEGLSGGIFSQEVPVDINRRVFDYDLLLILGPVFPHEVAGFSGGSKYLFPGISGPQVLNFFHWLGAVVTNPRTIGHKWTPVRAVIERAAELTPVPTASFCMVVQSGNLAGLYAGSPAAAWDAASDLSAQLHIESKPRPFHTVLSCAPPMYKDLWTGGKCMYKLEPVVSNGGELIIYAPHITKVSETHGAVIESIGYHTRDYFSKQWDRFKDEPWGVVAHSTHVKGIGTFDNGIETPRITVTLATSIPEDVCRKINLGFRDWKTIDIESYAYREDEGILLVRKAGEQLYRLEKPPSWAGGD